MNEEYKRARYYALNRLAAQSYHSALLHKLMLKKEYSPEIILQVIEECRHLGFLNDELWVENFIRSHEKKWGMPIILAKLRFKGIVIDSDSMESDSDIEKSAILKLFEGRYRSKNLSDPKERQKVISGMLRKGFNWENISAVLNQVVKSRD
jgi:regulatory protein